MYVYTTFEIPEMTFTRSIYEIDLIDHDPDLSGPRMMFLGK